MKVTILGSGAWQGIPAPFCSCMICAQAVEHPTSKNYRTRPEILVETGEGAFLLEVSPDIRLQSTRFHVPNVKDFVVSHWHFDHMYGLHELLTWMKKQAEKPTLHCSAGTKEKIDKEFSYLPMQVSVHKPFETFEVCGVSITPVPVYHMYTNDDSIPEQDIVNTFGYILEHHGKRVAYLADYYRVPAETLKAIQNVDVLIADGTYLQTDSFEKQKPNHLHGDDILRFTQSVLAREVYFHSISHLTQKTHEQMQAALPAAHYISYDGMQVIAL